MPLKKRKKPTVRKAPNIKRGSRLTEPTWDGYEGWTGKEVYDFRRSTREFYYENFKTADLVGYTYDWMKDNGYTKEEIRFAKISTGFRISGTVGIICRMDTKGAPREVQAEIDHWNSIPGSLSDWRSPLEYVRKQIAEAIEIGRTVKEVKEEKETAKKNVHQPTIQERILEKSIDVCEDIDNWIDTFDGKSTMDVKAHLDKNQVSQAHARKIKGLYAAEIGELDKVINLPTRKLTNDQEQIKEAYPKTKTFYKKLLKAYESVIGACDMIIESAKATRAPRKKKPRDASKLVARLNYMKEDKELSLVSINPLEIIGANELWVYSTKYRKFGKYVAEVVDPTGQKREGSGLSVKGTTIQGFKPAESIWKTLRKPEESLKQFKKAGKVTKRKFMDNLSTAPSVMSGRINKDIILVAVN